MHHTTVCYGTDQGTKTFDVEIQAPLVSDVQAGTSVPFSISLFPNPSNDRVTVLLSEIPAQAVNVELVDAKGVMVANYMIIGIQELTINTAKLSPGSYQIVLRSKGEAVAAENIVIVR
jgi:hypothetical protein